MRNRLRFLATYLLYWLGFFLVLRAVFLLALPEQTEALPAAALLGSFVHGFRLDLSTSAYLTAPVVLLLTLAALPVPGRRAERLVLPYTGIAAGAVALLAVADIGVYRGWGRRIDASVLPYLAYPREAWGSAALLPRGLLLALGIVLAAAASVAARRLCRALQAPWTPRPAHGLLLAPLGALLLLAARGGIQLIPVNQSSAYFSPSRFANQAGLNVAWNFFDSWRRGAGRERNPYLAMPEDSARALVGRARQAGGPAPARVLGPARPNILLIVWESLSARAFAPLGGIGATPELAALATQGLTFTRFYAAGDRTEKGMAALLAGAPTIPDAAILRLPAKAATLPMLSRDLAAAGYRNAFYYGGEPGFGNLRILASEGRFDRVVTKAGFPRADWDAKWGARDSAVAVRLLADLHAEREPFFAVWLTLSSHEPFEVPGPDRIPGRDSESRYLNALAYTDHVVGGLLRRAAAEPWWHNTLVVIVADHARRLERSDAGAPYQSAESWYHIPMLWTGGALTQRGVIEALGSQTDLAPTLLAQLGLAGGERYAFGRDLFTPSREPFAFYGFETGFGVVTTRGNLVWERSPGRITSRSGQADSTELQLGQAVLQLAWEDFRRR